MRADQADKWGRGVRILHWSMAVLMLLQAVGGWIGHELDRSPLKVDVLTAHKSLGITLLFLVMIRLALRLGHAPPPPPEGSGRWEIRAAHLSHFALYLLMIALPLSGWLTASTSIVPWKLWWVIPWPSIAPVDEHLHDIAGELHEALVWWLVAIIAVHIAAALWHHLVRRDNVLLRMLGAQR